MTQASLFLPNYGLMSGLTAGLTFTEKVQWLIAASTKRFQWLQELPHTPLEVGVCKEWRRSPQGFLNSSRFLLVSGMNARGGIAFPSRNPRVTILRWLLILRTRASGGPPIRSFINSKLASALMLTEKVQWLIAASIKRFQWLQELPHTPLEVGVCKEWRRSPQGFLNSSRFLLVSGMNARGGIAFPSRNPRVTILRWLLILRTRASGGPPIRSFINSKLPNLGCYRMRYCASLQLSGGDRPRDGFVSSLHRHKTAVDPDREIGVSATQSGKISNFEVVQ